jgi:hypothetical protein
VIRKRLDRLAIVLMTAALLAAAAFAAGPVAAANPKWDVTFVQKPNAVKAGHDVGWKVTFLNKGPSNINDLNITIDSTSTAAGYSYLSDPVTSTGFGETCDSLDGVTTCNVGTMPALGTVVFTVAFHVPATYTDNSFNLTIGLRAGTGDTGSDPGHSRGDKIEFTSNTNVSTNPNYDGGFTVDATTFQTGQAIGRNNKQATTLETTDLTIPVTVTDGVTSFPCNLCSNLVGEWSVLDVNGTHNDQPIRVTLLIWGGSVPGGVGADDLYLLHADGTGASTVVDAQCNATHSNLDCLESVTKIGNNFRIVAWFRNNGGARGAY